MDTLITKDDILGIVDQLISYGYEIPHKSSGGVNSSYISVRLIKSNNPPILLTHSLNSTNMQMFGDSTYDKQLKWFSIDGGDVESDFDIFKDNYPEEFVDFPESQIEVRVKIDKELTRTYTDDGLQTLHELMDEHVFSELDK